MDMNTRPECPKLNVGDEVLVHVPTYGRRPSEPLLATIVKAGRVWLTLINKDNTYMTWRMRRDTQREDTQSNYYARFVTREQYEYDQRLDAVDAVIKDAKVELGGRNRWVGDVWTPERRIALADFIVSLGILEPKEEEK